MTLINLESSIALQHKHQRQQQQPTETEDNVNETQKTTDGTCEITDANHKSKSNNQTLKLKQMKYKL